MTTGKTIALTKWTYVGKVMSLLFNTLSRFVIAFLPRSKCLLISWLHKKCSLHLKVTVCSDFGAQENKICHFFHFFPFYLPWSNGTWCHDLIFLNAEFQVSCFTLLSFTLIKRLFSSSSLSAFKVGSSAYLRLLIFFPAILIPACASSSCVSHDVLCT